MLGHLLNAIVHDGTLEIASPGGSVRVFGQGQPRITLRLLDRRAGLLLALDPDLALGELYMSGRLKVENGNIRDLLQLLVRNLARSGPRGSQKAGRMLRRIVRALRQINSPARAKDHVAHHYDLSGKLYDLFLDKDRQYSCAYFSRPDMSLEEAQAAKKRHIAAKLNLTHQDMAILDIGCGWGGLALDLARDSSATVLGITLSEEQVAVARRRSVQAGLAERAKFELADYRAVEGRFDRIVSIGMFEHVGARYYDTFFAKLASLLKPDGVILLHTIGRADGPGATNPWIAKYIFPGGYAPALSEVLAAIERNGLIVTDVEVLRQHYAETLREWQKRFQSNRAQVAKLYDERFCRMWEFYLAGSEMTFRYDGEVVYQIQIARRLDSLPITRDYMRNNEDALADAKGMDDPRRHAAA
jgi:cyclopropane-fatty-acyl-phospholipid synthase